MLIKSLKLSPHWWTKMVIVYFVSSTKSICTGGIFVCINSLALFEYTYKGNLNNTQGQPLIKVTPKVMKFLRNIFLERNVFNHKKILFTLFITF